MTTDPIILLMIRIPLSSNFPRILSTNHVSPYHHINAPKIILKYPRPISIGLLGITKANCAKVAINRKIMSGLEKVTKKAVTPL
jgi:hypothetical protein